MSNAQPKGEQKRDHSFREFGGVNTQADRRMIGENEFAWLENVMPVGAGNAKTIPAQSAAVATLVANCYYMAEGNISNTSYMYMFCTDGSCYQVNLASGLYEITTVGAAGTFSGLVSRIAQWKNERIVIIDITKGYFDWNGTTLTSYNGALSSVTVNFGGTGFTNATTTTLTPSSGSATFSATLGVNSQVFSAAGTGYVVGDVLTVTGGTFTSAATITVSSTGAAGAITAANLTTTGIYTVYPGANPIGVTGGHGTGATFTLTFGIYAVTVTNPGTGYVTAPTITIGGAGAGTAASLTVNLAVNTVGTTIAVYYGRVWFANKRTVVYSAPNSYNDFNPGNLAGSFIMTDDTLRANIMRLFSANNFLYIIGASSINVISNVTVTTPTLSTTGTILVASVTTFSNTNLSPSIGTEMADSVVSHYRTISMAMDYGIYGMVGASPQKTSDNLDGVYQAFDFSQAISGGLAIIYNVICLCYLMKYNDPITATARPLLCVYFNKKWFFASQGGAIKFVASASPDPDFPLLWGTDGTNLYKLFSNTTSNISQVIKTKLWDMGSSLITKQTLKFAAEITTPKNAFSVTANIDTEVSSQTYNFSAANQLSWTNNLGLTIVWTNNTGQPIVWLSAGYSFLSQDVQAVGNYLGLTLTSSSPGATYIGLHLQYLPRTPWLNHPL